MQSQDCAQNKQGPKLQIPERNLRRWSQKTGQCHIERFKSWWRIVFGSKFLARWFIISCTDKAFRLRQCHLLPAFSSPGAKTHMKRSELEHLIRASGAIADDGELIIMRQPINSCLSKRAEHALYQNGDLWLRPKSHEITGLLSRRLDMKPYLRFLKKLKTRGHFRSCPFDTVGSPDLPLSLFTKTAA